MYAHKINLSVAMLASSSEYVQVLSPSCSSPERDTLVLVSESVSSEPLAAASEPVTVAPVLFEPLVTASVSSELVPVAKTLVAKYPRTPPGMGNLAKKESSWAHYAVLSKILDDKRRIWNENSIAKKPRHTE